MFSDCYSRLLLKTPATDPSSDTLSSSKAPTPIVELCPQDVKSLKIGGPFIKVIILFLVLSLFFEVCMPIKLSNLKKLERNHPDKTTRTLSFGTKRDVELPSEVP